MAIIQLSNDSLDGYVKVDDLHDYFDNIKPKSYYTADRSERDKIIRILYENGSISICLNDDQITIGYRPSKMLSYYIKGHF